MRYTGLEVPRATPDRGKSESQKSVLKINKILHIDSYNESAERLAAGLSSKTLDTQRQPWNMFEVLSREDVHFYLNRDKNPEKYI